jgi:paraquat-inducible protein B
MKTRVSPAIVGAFALGAFALGIMSLLFFGGVSFFHKQQRFVVYFDESIQGLNLGSPVKLRGVAVGRVVDLGIRYEKSRNHSLVAVVCEFERNKVTDNNGVMIDVTNRAELQSLVDHGLRAQLGLVGLATGLLYVELDFLDPETYPAETLQTELKYPVVPAVPSTIAEFQASVTEILTKVKRIDFQGLADNLKSLLADTRRQVDAVDVKALAAQWQRAGASVEALASAPEVKQTFANLNATLTSLRGTLAEVRASLARVDTQVDANGRGLQTALVQADATLRQFGAAAVNLRRFIDAQQNLGEDSHKALNQLGDAAAAVQRLADFLERNPNALISGRKPPQ